MSLASFIQVPYSSQKNTTLTISFCNIVLQRKVNLLLRFTCLFEEGGEDLFFFGIASSSVCQGESSGHNYFRDSGYISFHLLTISAQKWVLYKPV